MGSGSHEFFGSAMRAVVRRARRTLRVFDFGTAERIVIQSILYPACSSHFSASIAAMQPPAAAVTAWR